MNENNRYAMIRTEKLDTKGYNKGTIYKALKHLDKHEKTADVSRPEMTQYNYSDKKLVEKWTYKNVIKKTEELRERHNQAVEERNKTQTKRERKLKQNAAQAFEVVVSFSPSQEVRIDRNEWFKKNVEFIKNKFQSRGCGVIRAEMHVDEATLHGHFILLSYDKELNRAEARSVLGGPAELSKLQDEYAEAMESFGLERGVSRYKTFESVKKRAIAAGYGEKLDDVKRYAADNNIELPKYRAHEPIARYKKRVEQELIKAEQFVESVENQRTQLLQNIELLKEDNEAVEKKRAEIKEINEKLDRVKKQKQNEYEKIVDDIFNDDIDRNNNFDR